MSGGLDLADDDERAGDAASIHEDFKQNAKMDPGLAFLREIKLTAEEEEEYTRIAKGNVPGILALESGEAETEWKARRDANGVKSFSKSAEHGLVVCKGQTRLASSVTLDMIQTQFLRAYNNSSALAQQMKMSDPMSRETRIMYQLPVPEDEFIRIVWGSFAAVGVTWPRDFCMLQHACPVTDDKTGERLFVVVAGSIERPEVPNMEKLCKRIRSTTYTTGYVFREALDGSVQATYIVNVNPNGWIPTKIVNMVVLSQTSNVARVRENIEQTARALTALQQEPPLPAVLLPWRGSHTRTIRRPPSGAAPARVTVMFWATAAMYFRISGAGGGATKDWKAEKTSGGISLETGQWGSYQKCTSVAVEFTILPVERKANGDANECSLEWKPGGWLKGASLFPCVKMQGFQ